MSDKRIPDQKITWTIAREKGKIKKVPAKVTFKLYSAGQFGSRLDGKHFDKRIPARRSNRKEFYDTMFRIKINELWYMPNGVKYKFFTVDEAWNMIKNYKGE